MSLYVVDSDIVQGVVEHMNDDHSDACLVIVRALGNQPNATHATMQWMDAEGADFQVSNDDGGESHIRIAFDKPISRDSQIRGHLVAMTKRARALTDSGTSP